MIYIFVTKKRKVIAKNFKSEKQAYNYRYGMTTPVEIWGKANKVVDWLCKYRKQLLAKALIKQNGKYL